MSSPRDPVSRLRHGLQPLSTFFPSNFTNSPISAISMNTPHAHSMHSATSAIQPYNPREWASSASGAERSHTFPSTDAPGIGQSRSPALLHHQQMQAPPAAAGSLPPPPPLPLPPPPYSPPRSQPPRPASTTFDHGAAQVPVQAPMRFSNMTPLRPSPEPQNPRSFPPPPGSSGRASSRERLFGITLSRRRDPREQSSLSPEPMQTPISQRQSAGPSSYHVPDLERTASPSMNNLQVIPPASRRAASTGAIDSPHSARSRSTSRPAWEPGMPVPPPPPRPPPSGNRSQSVQGIDRSSVPIISPPTRRPPPCGGTSLGPVPPTPADWVEEDPQRARAAGPTPQPPAITGRSPGLTIDVALASSSDQSIDPSLASDSSTGGLSRSGAVRNEKTIMERRSASRVQHGAGGSVDLSNIMVPAKANVFTHKVTQSESATHSAGRLQQFEQAQQGVDSARLNPQPTTQVPDSAKMKARVVETPPFSPSACSQASGSRVIPPKSLPTPPLVIRPESSLRSDSLQPPGSAKLPLTRQTALNQTADDFAAGSIERFRAFAAMEASAATDADRVRMFAEFVVSESRIRRERYLSAIDAMGSEIFDLTRDLFRPMTQSRRTSGGSSQGDWGRAPDPPATTGTEEDIFESTPRGDRFSNSAPQSPGQTSGAHRGAAMYKPSLSPILSMSVSDNYENGSSRGRAPSRWWEVDAPGDSSRSGFERSKRESKYMGVPKDQWLEPGRDAGSGRVNEHRLSSEYPPEKTGWHDQEEALLQTPHRRSHLSAASTPSSTMSRNPRLDVSRLVTLPPPYPRHHPAVNNNHPELSSIRTSVRALSQLDEVNQTKEKFAVASAQRRQEHSKAAVEGRQGIMAKLQKEIGSGNLSYATAAAIESDFDKQEIGKKKELEKTEYENFQNQVVLPLNEALTGRISQATELFDDLARHLFDNGEMDADMPQEEGDDRPELLEKLTLLKWIFEQRETLHRAIFDLLSDRNHRYCEVVLTPYRLSGNAEKLKSAEDFFAEDAAKREHAFAMEVLHRTREFRSVMDEAVARGVELQLSAFWDIAPPLCRLLEKIPSDLEDFSIQIPLSEYEENPSYHDHPLQYLYSLLLHAEKSSYQFIEAHTNQLCLLHEVKEAVVNAKAKALGVQPVEADGTQMPPADRERRAQHMKDMESRRLTEDLKEKVRMVQEQWASALGGVMTSVKERTGEWLLSTGGWDETLEDGGVGVS